MKPLLGEESLGGAIVTNLVIMVVGFNEIVDNCSGLPKLSSVVGIDDGREAAVWVEIDIWREFDVFKVDENSLVGKAKG